MLYIFLGLPWIFHIAISSRVSKSQRTSLPINPIWTQFWQSPSPMVMISSLKTLTTISLRLLKLILVILQVSATNTQWPSWTTLRRLARTYSKARKLCSVSLSEYSPIVLSYSANRICLFLLDSFMGSRQSKCLLMVCFQMETELAVIWHSFLLTVRILMTGYESTFMVCSNLIAWRCSLMAGTSSSTLNLRICYTCCLIQSENPFSTFSTSNAFNLNTSLLVWQQYLSTSSVVSSVLLTLDRVSMLLLHPSFILATYDFSAFSRDRQIFFFSSTKQVAIFYLRPALAFQMESMQFWIWVGTERSRSFAYNIWQYL